MNKKPDAPVPAIVSPDRVESALKVLEELASDGDQSGSVRAGAAKAILGAAVSMAGAQARHPRSASEQTLGELEAEIAATKERLKLVDPG